MIDFSDSNLVVALASFVVAAVTLIATIVAAIISYFSFRLKLGQRALVWFGYTQSLQNQQPYISFLRIENCKDKDLVIHNIYVRYGHNIYINLLGKDFNDQYHIVIPSLSAKEFNFGPAYLYSCSLRKIDLRAIIGKVKPTIVLATSKGKLVCGNAKGHWIAEREFFKNHTTAVIMPHRLYTKDSVYYDKHETPSIDYTSYNQNVLYVADIELNDDRIVQIPIEKDSRLVFFKNITFTDASLLNEGALKKFLNQAKQKNLLDFKKILKVWDVQAIIKEDIEKMDPDEIDLKAHGWLYHNSVGRFYSILGDIDLWLRNRKLKHKKNSPHTEE